MQGRECRLLYCNRSSIQVAYTAVLPLSLSHHCCLHHSVHRKISDIWCSPFTFNSLVMSNCAQQCTKPQSCSQLSCLLYILYMHPGQKRGVFCVHGVALSLSYQYSSSAGRPPQHKLTAHPMFTPSQADLLLSQVIPPSSLSLSLSQSHVKLKTSHHLVISVSEGSPHSCE